MENRKQAVLIVNTKSRRGREWYGAVKRTLEESGIELVEARDLTDPKRVVSSARDAVKREVPLVIVGGGDGTLHSVAGFFIGSNSVLGVLPLGTGNQFARDLAIEANVETACNVIINGKETAIDVATVGKECFLNVATVGLTTRIAEELTVEAKRRLGRFVYAIALIRAMRRVRPFRARLVSGDQDYEFETIQVVIGNGRFHAGPFPLAPDASITDGKLVVYAIKGTNRWDLLRFALRLPGGHHVELHEVPAMWSTGGRLETTPVERVTVDGEIDMRTPVEFGIKPAAIRVMTPIDFDSKPA